MRENKRIKPVSEDEMLELARRAVASGQTRSSFAQLAEWAHDFVTDGEDTEQQTPPPMTKAEPQWLKIDDNTETDTLHFRGLWVRHITGDGYYWEWQYYLGYIDDENGEFAGLEGREDFGWEPEDYTHWLRVEIPRAPKRESAP